jgi:hypothetical protein
LAVGPDCSNERCAGTGIDLRVLRRLGVRGTLF